LTQSNNGSLNSRVSPTRDISIGSFAQLTLVFNAHTDTQTTLLATSVATGRICHALRAGDAA